MNRIVEAVQRALGFHAAFGTQAFLIRTLRFWVWLPRLLGREPPNLQLPPLAAAASGVQPRELGINIAGYLSSEKGLGEAARSIVRAIRTTDLPVSLIKIDAPGARNREDGVGPFSQTNPWAVNLFCLNGGEIPPFWYEHGPDYFAGRYNIALWHWEIEDFPPTWFESFRLIDEVWVPTDFIQRTISRVSPVPVVKVPLSIEPPATKAALPGRDRFGIPDDAFVFLSVFDFHGIVERKNPLGIIRAFTQAFDLTRDVCLVLKCANGASAPLHKQEMLNAIGDNDRIIVIDRVLDNAEMDALYASCDCYVSLHRGEGFGLPLALAMREGKPVVATGYSGNSDFMSYTNSYPVGHRIVELGRDYPPYSAAWHWAEPDIEEAVQHLRRVYDNQGEAREKGMRARETILSQYSPEGVGAIIRQRLAVLHSLGKLPIVRDD